MKLQHVNKCYTETLSFSIIFLPDANQIELLKQITGTALQLKFKIFRLTYAGSFSG